MKTSPRINTDSSPTPSSGLVGIIASERQTAASPPIWIRLPKSGTVCPYTGLSRSALNALILGPNAPVHSVSLKKRYAIRGVRLINLESLLDYIASQASVPSESGKNDDK